ncbi:hypothetical protein KGQ19_11345, partial [Catenulispora sp. NL8]
AASKSTSAVQHFADSASILTSRPHRSNRRPEVLLSRPSSLSPDADRAMLRADAQSRLDDAAAEGIDISEFVPWMGRHI